MKTNQPAALIQVPRQLNLLFESNGLTGLSLLDRGKARIVLAQILMQAAGLSIAELDDDRR